MSRGGTLWFLQARVYHWAAMNHLNTTDIATENIHAANGRLGAGAKSPDGLARSAKNSTKHGLSSRSFCLLSNENPQRFAEHQAAITATLAPRDPLEAELVDKIIESKWLMNRVTEIETHILSCELQVQRADRAGIEAPPDVSMREATLLFFAMESLETKSKTFANLGRYRATHERAYYRALHTLQKMRGGSKTLATGSWPELPASDTQDTATQFCDSPPQPPAPSQPAPPPQPLAEPAPPPATPSPATPILQNEAPTESHESQDFTPRE